MPQLRQCQILNLLHHSRNSFLFKSKEIIISCQQINLSIFCYLLIAIDKTGTIVSVQAFDFPNKLLQDAALKAAKKVGYVASHEMVSNVELKVPVTFYLR